MSATGAETGMVGRAALWWWGEMAEMLAPVLARFRSVARLRVNDEGGILVSEAPGVAWARLGGTKPAGPLRLQLDPADAIVRTITLPAAARPHLDRALSLQAELETPFRAEDCRIGARILSTSGGQMKLELAVAPKLIVTDRIETLARAGLVPVAVEVAGAAGPIELAVDLPAPPRDWLALGLLLLCAGLAAAALWLPWQRLDARLALEAERADRLRPAASAALDAMDELDRLEADLATLKAMADRPLAVRAIDAISMALPDGAWLKELRIEDGTARLVGFAPDAAALPAVLERSPVLSGVRFAAPVTLAPGGEVERFDISATLERAEAAP